MLSFKQIKKTSIFIPIFYLLSFFIFGSSFSFLFALDYHKGHQPWPKLHEAIWQRHFDEAIKIMNEDRAFPLQVNQYTPFFNAHHALDGEAISTLIKGTEFVKVNWGYSALELAVAFQAYDLVDLILSKGSNINLKRPTVVAVHESCDGPAFDIQAVTPLFVAIQKKDAKMVDLLLDRGANPDEVVRNGYQTFWGSDFFVYIYSTWDNWLPLMQTGVCYGDDSVIRLLIQRQMGHGIQPEMIDQAVVDLFKFYGSKGSVLHESILKGNFDAFVIFLQHGCDPNQKCPNSPLQLALESKNPDFFTTLLSYNPKLNIEDNLVDAVKAGHFVAVKWFHEALESNYLPVSSTYLKNLFLESIRSKNLEVVQYLFSHKIYDFDRALELAISVQALNVLEFLFQNGFEHPQAFFLAVDTGNIDVLNLVTMYRNPTKEDIDLAIDKVLKQRNINRKMLDFLYQLK